MRVALHIEMDLATICRRLAVRAVALIATISAYMFVWFRRRLHATCGVSVTYGPMLERDIAR